MSLTSSQWHQSVTTAQPAPALGQHVVDHLRRLIITREVPAGTHLVEAQLSSTFDVSRGPVRDALRQLETEGLVESRRRGVYVIGLSPDDIEELYLLRELIETQVVKLCMSSDRDYAAAHVALERMRAAAERNDAPGFATADLSFHSAFYTLCEHRRLDSIWQQYRPTFANMLAVTNAEDADLKPTFEDHVRLLETIESGDESGAVTLLRAHIEGSHRRMLAAYARFVSGDVAEAR